MFNSRNYSLPHLILVIILVAGAVTIYFMDGQMRLNEIQKRESALNSVHDRTIAHIRTSIEKFGTFVSSIRAYINYSEEFPTEEKLQFFVNSQLKDMPGYDSLVVSLIDTSYTFVFSFNRYQLDPAKLRGVSLKTLRTQAELDAMDASMKSEQLTLIDPFNLIEGWVGIPIDFGVIKNGQSLGFIACIINFRNIIDNTYQSNYDNEFVFRFISSKGDDFDREAVYDGTPIHNTRKDTMFYRNFEVDENEFIYSDISLYGLDLKIGTAPTKPYSRNQYFSFLMYSWYSLLIIFSLVTMRSMYFYRRKSIESGTANELLREGNKHLQSKSRQIQTQNLRLNELIKTKNKFFAIISHDVKSPLNSIMSLLMLLKDQELQDSGIKEIVDQLTSSTQNTMKLLENLLSWAKLQIGDLKYEPSQVDLKVLADETIDVMIGNAESKQINLTSQIGQNTMVWADKNMILTVMRNAISNAIKFTKSGGNIRVYHIDDIEQITVAIADDGVGIAQKDVSELFKLDGKVKTVGTAGEKGTGLGLILCKEFIDKHNGHVCVESEVHRGTTFYFTLSKNFTTDLTSNNI